jgi:hypothetical protein
MARGWLQFITIMLAALSAGMAFCHLLEMPARLSYDPELWTRVTVLEGTYRLFGPPVGAALEVGALAAAIISALLERGRGWRFYFAVAGAALLIAAQIVWWMNIFPVNQAMAAWTPERLPENFDVLRRQWETSHAARATLIVTGLSFILGGALQKPASCQVCKTKNAASGGGDGA